MIDDSPVITGRLVTFAAAFPAEQLGVLQLSAVRAGPARQSRVDARVRVCVRQNYYHVPARYGGRRLRVRLLGSAMEVLDRLGGGSARARPGSTLTPWSWTAS